MNNVWHIVREYINTCQDDTITRKNLLSYLYSFDSLVFSECYIDTIRNQLEKCGYLGKMKTSTGAIVAGKYYRIKKIPDCLSVGLLRREYNEKITQLIPNK